MVAAQSDVFDLKFVTFTLGTLAPVVQDLKVVELVDADEGKQMGLKVVGTISWRGDPNIIFKVSGWG